jgi:tetratricopeptide (TPR) repeat protein
MRFPIHWSLFAGLLLANLGCNHFMGQKSNETASSAKPKTDSLFAKAEKPKEVPKRQPQANTCFKAGQVFEQTGDISSTGSVAQKDAYEKARLAYQQALDIEPKHPHAPVGLARVYEKQGDGQKALAMHQRAVQIHPEAASLWFEFGMCCGRQKMWKETIECLQKANRLEPNNSAYSNHLGFALARAGRYQESLDHFTQTVGEAAAYYNLASMLEHLGHKDASCQYAEHALAKNPSMSEPRALIARLNGQEAPHPQNAVVQGTNEMPDSMATTRRSVAQADLVFPAPAAPIEDVQRTPLPRKYAVPAIPDPEAP